MSQSMEMNLPNRESRLFSHLPELLKKIKSTCPGQSGNRWCQALGGTNMSGIIIVLRSIKMKGVIAFGKWEGGHALIVWNMKR